MRAAFDQVSALNVAPTLLVMAWDRFLVRFAQDNPFSTEDESLRAQAVLRKQAAESQSGNAPVSPPSTPSPVTPSPVTQPAQAVAPVATKPVVKRRTASVVAPPVTAQPVVTQPVPTPAPIAVVAQVVIPAPEVPVVATTPAPTPVVATTPAPMVEPVAPAVSPDPVAATTVEVAQAAEVHPAKPKIETFRDCPDCTEMVVIPAGTFMMGSPSSEVGRYANEVEHPVTIAKPFAVSKYEITFAEWDACVLAKGCTYQPDDEGWGHGKQPVIQVNWEDTKQFLQWLSQKTGKPYRLLTDEEWEYADRAGSQTIYPWGEQASHEYANYGTEACCAGLVEGPDVWDGAAPVGRFPSNAFGLYDMQGNVWEWVEDCSDASCGKRVLRGGSWNSYPGLLRSANRNENVPTKRPTNYGFRIARDLP
jgi:formylglycine-generating enzyme required for sulfatase activity